MIGSGPLATAWPTATLDPTCVTPTLVYSIAETEVWLTQSGSDFTVTSTDAALAGTSASLTITASDSPTTVTSPAITVTVDFVCQVSSITVDGAAPTSTNYELGSGPTSVAFPTFYLSPACPDSQSVTIISPADLTPLSWLTLEAGGF